MKRYKPLFEISRGYFPSRYKIGDQVTVNLGGHGQIYEAEIYAVRFEEATVWYDIRIYPYEEQYPGEGWYSIIKDVRATLFENLKENKNKKVFKELLNEAIRFPI